MLCCLFAVPYRYIGMTCSAQLLWEISGNGVKEKSYIFATYPLADISFLDSVPHIFKIYSDCEKIISEVNVPDNEAIRAIMSGAKLEEGKTLKDIYSPIQYDRISNAFRSAFFKSKLSIERLSYLKPAYLTTLYRDELLSVWLNYDPNRSLQTFFQNVAVEQMKPVVALDDIGEAIYMMFNREPQEWQEKELINIVEYPDRELDLEKELIKQYKKGNLEEMVIAVKRPDNLATINYSDYKVFATRNRTWVKRLKPYLKEGKVLICVNALFLGGDEGLLALLKAEGYKVKKYM